jgi:hypothetical protein
MARKISDLIEFLEAQKQIHGDAELVFDVPDLMIEDGEVHFYGDRMNGFLSKKVHIELHSKENKDLKMKMKKCMLF